MYEEALKFELPEFVENAHIEPSSTVTFLGFDHAQMDHFEAAVQPLLILERAIRFNIRCLSYEDMCSLHDAAKPFQPGVLFFLFPDRELRRDSAYLLVRISCILDRSKVVAFPVLSKGRREFENMQRWCKDYPFYINMSYSAMEIEKLLLALLSPIDEIQSIDAKQKKSSV